MSRYSVRDLPTNEIEAFFRPFIQAELSLEVAIVSMMDVSSWPHGNVDAIVHKADECVKNILFLKRLYDGITP